MAQRKRGAATYVATSPIHGRGLYAARDIPADTLIMRIEGKPTNRDGTYVIWSEGPDGPEGFRVTNDTRFVNHSREPNAAFYGFELWALRKIARDEEITHHYGDDWDDL